MNNPFTTTNMIKEPSKFFGRKEEIHHIVNRLKNMQSIAVVGDRRIGKSSLLYHFYQTGREKLDENYYFIYVDLQQAKYHATVNDLFKNILEELNVGFFPQETIQRSLIAFSDEMGKLKDEGKKIVLLFDEFEKIIKHRDEFPEDFFDQMRALLNESVIAMITSSQTPLRNLCLDGKLTSPFYNVFRRQNLTEFTEEEAGDFLTADWNIEPFNEDEICFIISYPQYCHPLLLQIICYWTVENRTMGLNDMALEEEIKQDAENYFATGFFNYVRRNRSEIIKGGKKLAEFAAPIVKKRLGGK